MFKQFVQLKNLAFKYFPLMSEKNKIKISNFLAQFHFKFDNKILSKTSPNAKTIYSVLFNDPLSLHQKLINYQPNPEEAVTYARAAGNLFEHNFPAQAIDLLNIAIKNNYFYYPQCLFLAGHCLKNGYFLQAIYGFEHSIEEEITAAELCYDKNNLAIAQFLSGVNTSYFREKKQLAITTLEEASALAPDNVTIKLNLEIIKLLTPKIKLSDFYMHLKIRHTGPTELFEVVEQNLKDNLTLDKSSSLANLNCLIELNIIKNALSSDAKPNFLSEISFFNNSNTKNVRSDNSMELSNSNNWISFS